MNFWAKTKTGSRNLWVMDIRTQEQLRKRNRRTLHEIISTWAASSQAKLRRHSLMTCKIKRKPRSSLDVLRDSAQFISALPHSPPPKSRIPAPVLNSCPLWETHLETYSARARRQASSGPKSLRFYLSLLRSTFSINAATLNNLEHKQEALEMNGFAAHGLDEDSFGEKSNIVQAFDYFRKSFLIWIWPIDLIAFSNCVGSV